MSGDREWGELAYEATDRDLAAITASLTGVGANERVEGATCPYLTCSDHGESCWYCEDES